MTPKRRALNLSVNGFNSFKMPKTCSVPIFKYFAGNFYAN